MRPDRHWSRAAHVGQRVGQVPAPQLVFGAVGARRRPIQTAMARCAGSSGTSDSQRATCFPTTSRSRKPPPGCSTVAGVARSRDSRVEDVLAIAAQMSSGGPTQLAHLVGAQLDASESYDSHSHRRRNGKLRRGRHRHANHPCTSITASTSRSSRRIPTSALCCRPNRWALPVTPEPFGDVTLAGSGNLLGAYSADTQARRRCAARSPPVATTVPDVRELDHGAAGSLVIAAGLVPRYTGRHDSQTPRCFISRRPPAPLPVAGILSRCCSASNLFRDVT